MRLLSQTYQGLPPPDDPPTFTKPVFPAPNPDLIRDYMPSMPHLAETRPQSELGVAYAQNNSATERVDFHIEGRKLRQVREKVTRNLDATYSRPSIQDCLTAYLVTVLNRCLDTPISEITNAASVRYSILDGDLACLTYFVVSPTIGTVRQQRCRGKCNLHCAYDRLEA